MPDRRIIRYMPGGKYMVIGLKPHDALPITRYDLGKSVCSFQNEKNAKEILAVKDCEYVACPGIYIDDDGGNASSEFTELILDGNLEGEILDAQLYKS